MCNSCKAKEEALNAIYEICVKLIVDETISQEVSNKIDPIMSISRYKMDIRGSDER